MREAGMSQMSVSAVGTGSAVGCSAKLSACRRVVGIVICRRLCGKLALSGGAKSEVLGARFIVARYEFPVSRNYPTPTLPAREEGARLFARFAAIAKPSPLTPLPTAGYSQERGTNPLCAKGGGGGGAVAEKGFAANRVFSF